MMFVFDIVCVHVFLAVCDFQADLMCRIAGWKISNRKNVAKICRRHRETPRHRETRTLRDTQRRWERHVETIWRTWRPLAHGFLDCHMLHLESFFIWGSVWDVWVRTCQNSGFPSAHWSISTLRHKAAGDPGNLSNSQCPTVLSPAKPFEHHGMPQNVTSITSRITQVV